jgi:hypothetical protein
VTLFPGRSQWRGDVRPPHCGPGFESHSRHEYLRFCVPLLSCVSSDNAAGVQHELESSRLLLLLLLLLLFYYYYCYYYVYSLVVILFVLFCSFFLLLVLTL